MAQTDEKTFGFPSQFVDPEIKKTAKYCKSYAVAFDGDCKSSPTETGLIRASNSYTRLRKLGRGENDPNAYKEQMTMRSEDGSPNVSFRNLSWQIVKIAPKLRNVLKAKVVNHDWRMNVRTIDSMAMSRRRYEKAKILEYMTNQEAITAFEEYSAKIKLDRPVPEEDLQDINPHSIDTYLDMNPRDMTAMEVKDLLTYTMMNADWGQKADEGVGDLIDIGVMCMHPYVDEANTIQLERWFPEKTVTNKCVTNDFRDMIRIGYYDDITVSEIKRQTKGSLGEEAYKEIACKNTSGKSYSDAAANYWQEGTYSYAYDHEKVRIFKCFWYSDDNFTYTEYKNEAGNNRMKRENFNYVPFKGDGSVNEGKGMSDEEFHQFSGGTKTIYRDVVRNVYRCTWIIGTDHVYNYGLANNMFRQAKSYKNTMLPVAIYTTDKMSTVGNIEALLDQFQLNWLQFQAHVAASKPPGVAIEKNALARAAMGPGQSGQKVDWKKLLQMYAESGNIVYDGYDTNGNPLPQYPFSELKNGLSEGAVKHLEIMIMMLDFIRNILGINALVEGEAPPERLGKAVAELSFGATTNALSYLNDGYKSVYEQTCKLVLGMLPDAVQAGQLPSFQEAMGMETMRFLDLNKDLGLLDLGIYIEEGPDDVVRQRISQAIELAIKNQDLDPEDAVYVELEENPYRAIQYLKMKRRQKQRMKQRAEQSNIQLQGEEVRKTEEQKQKMLEDAEIRSWERERQKLVLQQTFDTQDKEEAFTQQVILMKLENKIALSTEQEEFVNKKALTLAAIREQGKIDEKIARINAKNRSLTKTK
jgi:hypothetical protein